MTKNMFGTDGVRNTVGVSPFTIKEMPQFGLAIAQWAERTYGKNPHILLASDTRISCSWASHAFISGAILSSASIYDAGIIPTPALLQIMQKKSEFHCAIMISASHNPYHHNGIKIIDRVTSKISTIHELMISELFQNQIAPSYDQFGTITQFSDAQRIYCDAVTATFSPSSLAGKTIVLDCAHGATSAVAPAIFETLGARIITINNTPNGRNINEACGSVHPEALQKAVLEHCADAGFAFDGDGDRLTMVAPDGSIKNGDDILALLVDHPLYRNESSVVGTIVSNHGLSVFLQKRHKKLVRVNVGDKHIVEYLQKNNLQLGGEQSGHIIMRDYQLSGDGIVTALRIMEAIQLTNNTAMKTFTRYPQILINLPIAQKKDLQSPSIAEIIAQHEAQLNSGRLVVRYSGTENVLRIMVEDENETTAQAVSDKLACVLERELQ